MGTPIYNVRLAKEDQELLVKTGRTYGAPNTSVFLREMIRCVCSDETEDAQAFIDRLTEKMTGQIPLSFSVASKPRKQATRGKEGKRRVRPT